MIQIIKILKKRNKVINILLIFSLTFLNCSMNKEKHVMYYGIYDNSDNIPKRYNVYLVSENENKKDITIYKTDGNCNITDTTNESYSWNDKTLFIKFKSDSTNYPLLSINKDSCVSVNHPDKIFNVVAFTKTCYIKDTIFDIGRRKIKVHEFAKKTGNYEGVNTIILYDKSFNFISQKYISGNAPYFRIKLINEENIPEKLKKIFN